jgi:hypothetical protein
MSDVNIPIVKPNVSNENSSTIPLNKPAVDNIPQQFIKPTTVYSGEEFDLPSRGHFYDEKNVLSSGKIKIKYMTAKEEDILTSQSHIKKGIVLDKLLESVILTPGVNMDDLLLIDKNALYFYARRLAYGDEYTFDMMDTTTGNTSYKTVNLSELKVTDFDFSKYPKGINRFSYVLPFSKKNIEFKLLTHKDETSISLELKQLKQDSKEITTRLKYMILSIDGKTDKFYIKNFVDNELLSKDSVAFRDNLKKNFPELNTTYLHENDNGDVKKLQIPMRISFFWPNAET